MQSHSYRDSPLGIRIKQLLKRIGEIRKSYDNKKDHSLEKKHADHLLDAVIELLTKVHENHLPNFSDQKPDPTYVWIIKDFIFNYKIYKNFQTREYVLFLEFKKQFPQLLEKAITRVYGEGFEFPKYGHEGVQDEKSQQKYAAFIDELMRLLASKVNDLPKRAAAIPGKDLAEFFEEMKGLITNYKLFSKDDHIKRCKFYLEHYLFMNRISPFKPYTMDINHPMLFEILIEAARLFKDIPYDLKELMPFFNPISVSLDLAEGALGKILKKFTKNTFMLRNKAASRPELHPTFTYEVIINSENNQEIQEHDAADYYTRYLHWGVSYLLRMIKLHQKRFEVPHLDLADIEKMYESELERIKLLRQFCNNEVADIKAYCSQNRCEEAKSAEYFAQYEGFNLLRELKAAIEVEQRRASLNEHLVSRYQAISERSFKYLLESSHQSEVRHSVEMASRRGLDMSFAETPVPDLILNTESLEPNLKVLAIAKSLFEYIDKIREELCYVDSRLENLTKRYRNAFLLWKNQKLEAYASQIKEQLNRLGESEPRLSDITMFGKESVSAGRSVDSYRDMLLSLTDHRTSLKSLNDLVQHVSLSVSPERFLSRCELDHDLSQELQNEIMDARLAVTNIDAFKRRVTAAKTMLDACEIEIRRCLKSAEEEVVFQENLRTQDVDSLQEMLGEARVKYQGHEDNAAQVASSLLQMTQQTVRLQEKLAAHAVPEDHVPGGTLESNHAEIKAIMSAVMMCAPDSVVMKDEAEQVLVSCVNDEEVASRLINQLITMVSEDLHNQVDQCHSIVECEMNLQHLRLADNCVAACTDSVPFIELDGIFPREESRLRNGADSQSGFNRLLDLLGMTDKTMRLEWENFRSMQDDAFRFKPAASTTEAYRNSLIALISTTNKRQENLLHELRMADQARKVLLAKSIWLTESLEKVTRCFIDRNIHSIDFLRGRIVFAERSHFEEKIEIARLNESIPILSLRVQLLASLKTLTQGLDGCQKSMGRFSTDLKTYQDFCGFEVEAAHLDCLRRQLDSLIQSSSDPSLSAQVYQSTLQLLKSTQDKIQNILEEKFSPEKNLLKLFREKMAEFAATHDVLMEDGAPYQALLEIYEIQSRLQAAIEVLRSRSVGDLRNANFDAVLTRVEGEFAIEKTKLQDMVHSRLNRTRDALSQCDQWWRHALGNVIGDYEEKTQSSQHLTAEIARSMQPYLDSCDAILDETQQIKINLDQINAHLVRLKDVPIVHPLLEKAFSLNCDNLLNSWRDKFSRVQMSGKFSTALNDYLVTRHQRYRFKDLRLSAKDKLVREHFVAELQAAITAYVESGNAKPLLDTIALGHINYPGLHLRTLLNQMMAAIDDFECQSHSREATNFPLLRSRSILENRPRDQFTLSLEKLYQEISELENQAALLPAGDAADRASVTLLAHQLRTDVNRYVVASAADGIDRVQCYLDFKAKFHVRLHSQDVMLQKYQPVWAVVANIALAIASVFLYLPCRLIFSKLYYGHASLLFSQTSKIDRKISNLDDVVNNADVLLVPARGA